MTEPSKAVIEAFDKGNYYELTWNDLIYLVRYYKEKSETTEL